MKLYDNKKGLATVKTAVAFALRACARTRIMRARIYLGKKRGGHAEKMERVRERACAPKTAKNWQKKFFKNF